MKRQRRERKAGARSADLPQALGGRRRSDSRHEVNCTSLSCETWLILTGYQGRILDVWVRFCLFKFSCTGVGTDTSGFSIGIRAEKPDGGAPSNLPPLRPLPRPPKSSSTSDQGLSIYGRGTRGAWSRVRGDATAATREAQVSSNSAPAFEAKFSTAKKTAVPTAKREGRGSRPRVGDG